MTEHAELPWRVEVSTGEMDGRAKFETGSKVLIYSEDCEHHPVADCSCNHSCRMPFEQEDNAALIVEAVNSYAALKARVQMLEDALREIAANSSIPITLAKAALAGEGK